MGRYKIRIYSHAKADLKDIISYLNTLSPQVAIRYYDLIVEKISSLSEMPERCPFVRDVVLKAKGYRYLIIEGYMVFFVIRSDTVQIRRIIHGRRNYGMAVMRDMSRDLLHMSSRAKTQGSSPFVSSSVVDHRRSNPSTW
jgi:plasmid stabilization system protein ParE